jgi:SAM-dependent methyltransferase
MRLGAIPQNIQETIALAAGRVPTPLMDTLVALLLAKTVMAGAAVGIFQMLDAGPLRIDELANRCRSDAQATERLVRALFASKYIEYHGDRVRLAPVARRWLSRDSQSLLPAILQCQLDLRFMNFEEYVRHGRSLHFHADLSAEDWHLYHQGQAQYASQMIQEVIENVPLSPGATDLLDLGGGHGHYAVAFCRRYRNLRAKVLDISIATGEQEARRASDQAYDRVKFEAGDIRITPLERCSTDAVLLANVMHHFDEATNRSLIQRIATALRPGGLVVLVDAMRSDLPEETSQLEGLLDLYFAATSGAGLWTIAKVQEWAREAGLAVMPPNSIRHMPFCKMQIARKPI